MVLLSPMTFGTFEDTSLLSTRGQCCRGIACTNVSCNGCIVSNSSLAKRAAGKRSRLYSHRRRHVRVAISSGLYVVVSVASTPNTGP